LARGIRAVVLYALACLPHEVELDWNQFVAINLNQEDAVGPRVNIRFNHFHDLIMLLKCIGESEPRAVGSVIYESRLRVTDDDRREAALLQGRQWLSAKSRRIPILKLQPYKEEFETVSERVADWYSRYRPRVVIGQNALVWHAMRHRGVSCPRDVEFISLSIDADTEEFIAGYLIDWVGVAKLMIGQLDLLLRAPITTSDPYTIVVASTWQDGPSWNPSGVVKKDRAPIPFHT